MDVKDAINKRRSVRAFLDKEVNVETVKKILEISKSCLLYTSPSPRDVEESRMPSSA